MVVEFLHILIATYSFNGELCRLVDAKFLLFSHIIYKFGMVGWPSRHPLFVIISSLFMYAYVFIIIIDGAGLPMSRLPQYVAYYISPTADFVHKNIVGCLYLKENAHIYLSKESQRFEPPRNGENKKFSQFLAVCVSLVIWLSSGIRIHLFEFKRLVIPV